MAEELFPSFDIPDIDQEYEDEETYYPSVYFDYETGDFALDGAHRMITSDGREAWIQWCMKVIGTERETCLAYSTDIGTEFEEMDNWVDQSVRESEIEETITEALLVHPCTESVSDFEFEHLADECYVSFVVKGYAWNEVQLTTVIER